MRPGKGSLPHGDGAGGSLAVLPWRAWETPKARAAWDALAMRSGTPNPFFETWYLLPGLARFDPRGRIRLASLVRGGALEALVPLQRARRYGRHPLPHLAVWLHANAFLGAPLVAAGLGFGWHNHDFEFAGCADGTVPMFQILTGGPTLEWEMDVAWVVRGGSNPLAWIDAFKGRITAAHVKDIAAQGQAMDEDGWADVGHGVVEWAAIFAALKSAGVQYYVMEHDNPADDRRFATRSLASGLKL
jgi:hypothetical protein